jgi:hypothetical protein
MTERQRRGERRACFAPNATASSCSVGRSPSREPERPTRAEAIMRGCPFVAKTATKSRLPLAVEGSHADEAGVSEWIDDRTI